MTNIVGIHELEISSNSSKDHKILTLVTLKHSFSSNSYFLNAPEEPSSLKLLLKYK